ncbi:MAG: ABC transporter permease, partial [Oscillospiraceae bacterium]|nr:ABC transporter permease [Oscillospiraceae bacterium]
LPFHAGQPAGPIRGGGGFFPAGGIYGLVEAGIGSSDTLQLITVLPFASMAPLVLLAFVVTGLVIGVLGSILAIGKFLQV